MAVREFNGTSDIIHFPAGDLDTIDGDPLTVMFLWKPLSLHRGGLIYVQQDGSNQVFNVNPYNNGEVWLSTSAGAFGVIPWTGSDGWMLAGMSSTAGVTNLIRHKYLYSSEAWEHTAVAGGLDPTGNVAVEAWVGRYAGGIEYLHARLAAIGVWGRILSEAEVETLTGGLQAWFDLSPTVLWAFNQANAVDQVEDLSGGGADSDDITGTTIITDDDPPDFSFSLIDLAVQSAVHAQVADNVTLKVQVLGGWHQLRQVLDERAQLVDEELARGPVACPNDGEPLRTGPGGVLFCPFDGWRASA